MSKVCDCFPELKEITEARERRYRAHPEKAAPEGPQSFVEVKVTSIGPPLCIVQPRGRSKPTV